MTGRGAQQIVSMDRLNNPPDLFEINKMLAAQLIHNTLEYADIETIHDAYSGNKIIRATMKVVDMAGQEGSNGQAGNKEN